MAAQSYSVLILLSSAYIPMQSFFSYTLWKYHLKSYIAEN